jgi:hypothetical protein
MKIWKDIKGYEGVYKISNYGEVYSIFTNKVLKPHLKEGYYEAFLYNNGKKARRIHSLVAEYFVPNPGNLPRVNHIDNNKLNNCYRNLEWYAFVYTDRLENTHYVYLSANDILTIYDSVWNCHIPMTELADQYNVRKSTINDIKSGKKWSGLTRQQK